MSSHRTRKDYEEIVEELRRQGWTVVENENDRCHFKARSPAGAPVFFAVSTEWCALRNTISLLRRHGFIWEGR